MELLWDKNWIVAIKSFYKDCFLQTEIHFGVQIYFQDFLFQLNLFSSYEYEQTHNILHCIKDIGYIFVVQHDKKQSVYRPIDFLQ